jgi:hypothetical protein
MGFRIERRPGRALVLRAKGHHGANATQITGIAFCCASAKSGYAAAPARTVMKFRRLIPSPPIRRWARIMALQSHFRKAGRIATFHPTFPFAGRVPEWPVRGKSCGSNTAGSGRANEV